MFRYQLFYAVYLPKLMGAYLETRIPVAKENGGTSGTLAMSNLYRASSPNNEHRTSPCEPAYE